MEIETTAIIINIFMVAVAGGALFVAIKAYKVAKNTFGIADNTLRQLKRDSIEQTRPYVHARLVPSISLDYAFDLIIENSGKSIARSVLLSIKEEYFPKNSDSSVEDSIRGMTNRPFDLAPNSKIRVFWIVNENNGMSPEAQIILKYRSDDPNAPRYMDYSNVYLTPALSASGRSGPDYQKDEGVIGHNTHKVFQAICQGIWESNR